MSLGIFRRSAAFWAALTFVAICSAQAGQPLSNSKEQKLSPEGAKEALLKTMRSKPMKDFG
jgi:hypothetical protein